MKKLIAVAFALFMGAFLFGIGGHSLASPATPGVAAVATEAAKADVTPVRWRYYRRCRVYRVWIKRHRCGCWRPAACCCGGGGILPFLPLWGKADLLYLWGEASIASVNTLW